MTCWSVGELTKTARGREPESGYFCSLSQINAPPLDFNPKLLPFCETENRSFQLNPMRPGEPPPCQSWFPGVLAAHSVPPRVVSGAFVACGPEMWVLLLVCSSCWFLFAAVVSWRHPLVLAGAPSFSAVPLFFFYLVVVDSSLARLSPLLRHHLMLFFLFPLFVFALIISSHGTVLLSASPIYA